MRPFAVNCTWMAANFVDVPPVATITCLACIWQFQKSGFPLRKETPDDDLSFSQHEMNPRKSQDKYPWPNSLFSLQKDFILFSPSTEGYFSRPVRPKIRLKLQQRSPSLDSVQTCFFITAVLSTSEFHPRSGKKSVLGLLTWLIAWGLGASEFIFFFCYSALSIA